MYLQGVGVFEYMNDGHVLDLTRDVYRTQLDAVRQFDMLYGMANPAGPSNLRDHLPQFERRLATRMVNNHRRYMDDRLDQLAAPWVDIQNSQASTQQQRIDATQALNMITNLRSQIPTFIRFNADSYINRP